MNFLNIGLCKFQAVEKKIYPVYTEKMYSWKITE